MKQEAVKQSGSSLGSKLALGFGAVVLVLFLLGLFTARDIRHMGAHRSDVPSPLFEDSTLGEEQDRNMPQTGTDSGTLTVVTQTPGLEARVQRMSASRAGWVVVHEVEGGHVVNALGARRIDAGVHEDVAIELLRATEPGREYAVILYADNGNREFEVRGDLPMIDTKGNPLMQTFRTFGGGASMQ